MKAVGDTFSLKTSLDASGETKVSWTKVKVLVVNDRGVELLLMGKKKKTLATLQRQKISVKLLQMAASNDLVALLFLKCKT